MVPLFQVSWFSHTQLMSFFEIPAESDEEPVEPQPRRRRWRGDDSDTLGTPVPISVLLARTEEVAVLAGGFVAFPLGFSLSVISLSRLDPPRQDIGTIGPRGPWREGRGAAQGVFRFGIGFADGSKVTTRGRGVPEPRFVSTHPATRSLQARGGGGSRGRFTQSYWCAPLPPSGVMQLVCEWQAAQIAETFVEIDADLILRAAEESTALWEEDKDLPPDDDWAPRSWDR